MTRYARLFLTRYGSLRSVASDERIRPERAIHDAITVIIAVITVTIIVITVIITVIMVPALNRGLSIVREWKREKSDAP